MKFWKATLFSSLCLVCLFLGIAMQLLHISKEDKDNYRKLMDVSHSSTSLKNDSSYTAKQLKEGAKKTLLIQQGDERKIGKLSCRSSILCFSKEAQKSELREEMRALDLLYQEELLPEGQIVVHIMADHAIYYYNREKLDAENVRIARYRMPSHRFPEELHDPFFRGTADSVSIVFGHDQPQWVAKNLKGISL